MIRVQEVIDHRGRRSRPRSSEPCASATNLPAGQCPAASAGHRGQVQPRRRQDHACASATAPDLDVGEAADRRPSRGIALREGENNPSLQNARDNKVEIQLKSKGDQLMDGLRAQARRGHACPTTALRVEWIGPKAGAQLRDAALKAIAIAIVFIMVYIAFRFDLRFAPGAVIAMVHDARQRARLHGARQPRGEPDHGRRGPDHRRLFGERHRDRLRSRAREPGQACAARPSTA